MTTWVVSCSNLVASGAAASPPLSGSLRGFGCEGGFGGQKKRGVGGGANPGDGHIAETEPEGAAIKVVDALQ